MGLRDAAAWEGFSLCWDSQLPAAPSPRAAPWRLIVVGLFHLKFLFLVLFPRLSSALEFSKHWILPIPFLLMPINLCLLCTKFIVLK